MDVRIDKAGKNELSGGIDDFGAWGCVAEVVTDFRNSLVFDEDVGHRAGVRVDDVGVLDEEGHRY